MVLIYGDFPGFAHFTPCSGRGFQFVGIRRGWTLMCFRTVAAGAGMLAALTLAATSTAPAEPADTKPSTTNTRTAKPPHRAAKPQREAKSRHGKRTRVARQRHRHPPETAARTAHRPAAPTRTENPTAARQETASARRFREFLDPQSFALVVNEQLRSPRLLAAQFSGEIADPALVVANATTPVAEPRAEAPPIVAHDQITGDDSPSSVQRVERSEKEPDRMSFLRWFFVAWGGVLTLASAVRMAMG
jgi:hypothetical protein